MTDLSILSLGLSLAALAFVAIVRRRLRSGDEAVSRRLDALAERVARLEKVIAPEPPGSPELRPRPAVTRRADRPAPTAVTGPTLIEVPNLAAPAGEFTAASADLGRRFGAVWELADAGAPAETIARATGQPIGQVELILGLRRQLTGSGMAGGTRPESRQGPSPVSSLVPRPVGHHAALNNADTGGPRPT